MDIEKAIKTLNTFFDEGEQLRYDRRSLILHANEKTDQAFWITDGLVKVVTYSSSGRETIQALYGKNELFPMAWVYDHKLYNAVYIAFTDITLRAKPLRQVRELIKSDPAVLHAFVSQLLDFVANVINLNLGDAKLRAAYRLVVLAERFGDREGDHFNIGWPITIKEFADSIRMSRESAGKVLSELENDNSLIFGREKIVVYPDRLRKFLDE